MASNLSEAESNFLRAITMWGSDAYPLMKSGRKWLWVEFWGVRGAPVAYNTKRAAVEAIERYYQTLLDRKAGRV